MSKQGFALVHHAMSMEDPESGWPASVEMTSEDKQKLIDYAQAEMDDGDYAETKMVDVNGETHFLGAFEEGGRMSTYWVIEPTTIA